MTEKTGIEKEIEEIWQAFADEFSPAADDRFDVKSMLDEAESEAVTDANEHLSFWIILLDEALHCVLVLNEFAGELSNEGVDCRGFKFLCARLSILIAAIRKLVIVGLEDIARIVTRSLIETLDLTLVSLGDKDFAEKYASALDDEGYDANEFWRKNIGYGKLDKRIKKVLDNTNLTDEQINSFFDDRQVVKEHCSSSVHSSAHSALLSEGIPSLSRPGMIAISKFGHVSIYSPGLLSSVIMQIHRFGVTIFHLVAADEPPIALKDANNKASYPSLLTAFMTLQELTQRYANSLPPPFYFPDVDDE